VCLNSRPLPLAHQPFPRRFSSDGLRHEHTGSNNDNPYDHNMKPSMMKATATMMNAMIRGETD
jgi:hypothetical protein